MSERQKIVTAEQLNAIPRWAIVAFAARAARRVQRGVKALWPEAPQDAIEAVDDAIRLAESAAQAGRAPSTDYFETVGHAVHAAVRAATDARGYDVGAQHAQAASAADCAFMSADPAISRSACADRAAKAAAMACACRNNDAELLRAIRSDFEFLRLSAAAEYWTDDTPVPPDSVGSLWPNGDPERQEHDDLHESDGIAQLVIALEIPEGCEDQAVIDRIRRLVSEMDHMHRKLGGGGLRIDDIDIEVPAGAPVRAPA